MGQLADELLGPAAAPVSPPVGRPASPPPPAGRGGSLADQLLGPATPSASPETGAPADDAGDSWWQRHGREVELAAAGGAALLLGPRMGRMGAKALRSAGQPGEGVLQFLGNVKATLAPSTIDDAGGRAAGFARAEGGLAARKTAQAETALEPLWQDIGRATPAEQLDFINYVETRSQGTKLANPKHQPLADELARVYAEVHDDMKALKQYEKMGFIEDYYRHQWVKDAKQEAVFSREGKGGFMKERKIPTIAEGIAQGLTPRTLDPVQTTLEYVSNARRLLANSKVLDSGMKSGDVILRQLGTKKPFPTDDVWMPLEGYLAKRGAHQLYAKEGFARVYNNFVGTGFTGPAGELVNTLRRTSNNITALELGLSGFHATTMANEAIINDVAKAVSNLAGGRIKQSLIDIVKSPIAPYRLAKRGSELEKVYLGKKTGNRETELMADLLTAAGGRAKGIKHATDYEYTAMNSFFESWQKGAFRAERLQYAKNIKENPFTGIPTTLFSLIGRTMKTVSEPLFKYYIPKLKTGAFSDTMQQWLDANPGANRAQMEAQARKVWDTIDNRFGESVNDNTFWRQHMKQVAMIAMRSYSWNMGTIREIGGGILDVAQHKGMTPRVAYIIALPIVYGAMSAVYQYLKTGEKPKDSLDLMAPRTGGTDPKTGLPERMIMPGYMKDVFGWYKDPVALAEHKLSAFVTTGKSMITGKDWKGDPIRPPNEDPNAPYEQTAPSWLKAYLQLVATNFSPISVRELSAGRKEGTNINYAEQFLGLRGGGQWYTNPEGYKKSKERREQQDWRRKQKFDIRQERYRGNYER